MKDLPIYWSYSASYNLKLTRREGDYRPTLFGVINGENFGPCRILSKAIGGDYLKCMTPYFE